MAINHNVFLASWLKIIISCLQQSQIMWHSICLMVSVFLELLHVRPESPEAIYWDLQSGDLKRPLPFSVANQWYQNISLHVNTSTCICHETVKSNKDATYFILNISNGLALRQQQWWSSLQMHSYIHIQTLQNIATQSNISWFEQLPHCLTT